MISSDLLQKSIIGKLWSNTALVAVVNTGSIREYMYQGTDITYPAIRIEINPQIPIGDTDVSRIRFSTVNFTIHILSEQNSSKEAGNISGLVHDALFNKQIDGTDYNGNSHHKFVRIDEIIVGNPIRLLERVWEIKANYQAQVSALTNL